MGLSVADDNNGMRLDDRKGNSSEGQIRADHELSLWGVRFLRLPYRLRELDDQRLQPA